MYILCISIFMYKMDSMDHGFPSPYPSGTRFHQVVTSRQLGQLAASLGGWSGARVAEDQAQNGSRGKFNKIGIPSGKGERLGFGIPMWLILFNCD